MEQSRTTQGAHRWSRNRALPSSVSTTTRGAKFAHYQTLAAFEEYLLIDSRRRAVEHFQRTANDAWLYHRYGDGDTISLDTIGLAMPVASLYLASGL